MTAPNLDPLTFDLAMLAEVAPLLEKADKHQVPTLVYRNRLYSCRFVRHMISLLSPKLLHPGEDA